jgi:hypothetical protein
MSVREIALAYYRQRLRAVDPRLLFARWLYRTGRIIDWPVGGAR